MQVNEGVYGMQGEFDLSIIIVNYMKYEMTQSCVESINKYLTNLNYEIIILDNCSLNNSFEVLNELYESNLRVNVIKSSKNNGFGAGNNEAVEHARAEFILFLNPDVLLIDNSIEMMFTHFKNNKEIGVIGAQLLNGDYTLQYSCRKFLKFTEFIQARTPLKKIISKSKVLMLNNKYLMLDINHEKPQNVDWLMGSCLLVRKQEFLNLGGFSEEYFMYFEDVDLCYKYGMENKLVYYYPETKMIHLHEQESVKKFNKLTIRHLESMFKFYKKYRSK